LDLIRRTTHGRRFWGEVPFAAMRINWKSAGQNGLMQARLLLTQH